MDAVWGKRHWIKFLRSDILKYFMLENFRKFIVSKKLFTKKDRILVAVSGGIDSIVLCHLLHQCAYEFGIAHCNFQLRGKESDADERFVGQLATKFNVPFFVKKFDTKTYSGKNKVSIQMAARDLRYAWFEEIRAQNNYSAVAVAHHRNDEMETFFINLIRGTGIAGLHGIRAMSGRLVRPLLFAGRKEIEDFAKENKITYREDSSNSSIKYLRNRIRLQLIPLLKELNPQIETTIKEDIQKISQMEEVMLELVEEKRKEIMSMEGDAVKFDINKLLSLKNISFFLYEFLRSYGYSGDIIEKISKSLKTKESKQFFSSTHSLVKDREILTLSLASLKEPAKEFLVDSDCKELNDQLHLKFKKRKNTADFKIVKESRTAMFDMDKLEFPLTIRKWKSGDFFYPFGMRGKKKLSDFFTDLKLSLMEKEKVWLLCNKSDIIWVIGHRTDNRYKITSKTKKVFTAEIL